MPFAKGETSMPLGARTDESNRCRSFAMWIALLVAALVTTACQPGGDAEIPVRLESGPLIAPGELESTPLQEPEVVRFAYASVLSPERSSLVYAHLGSYLSSRMGRPVEIVRRRTYEEVNELFRTGSVDAGLVCSGAFALGQVQFGLEALVIPVVDGSTTYRSNVIVRRDSGVESFDDLRGLVFAFSDPLSNSGYRYVAARLHDQGTTPAEFFSRFLFTYSHDNTIEAVLDGIVQAGSVDSLVWDDLVRSTVAVQRELRVIERSPEFPINPVAVSAGVDPLIRQQLHGILLGMHEDPEGAKILDEMGASRFIDPTAEALVGYAALAQSWADLGSFDREP
jgi:phosphate/phosphite/phosphonate ABC transporter binding protein